jgi:anti-sigma28 factor (negative regulator of flagellin synthesis)
MYDRKWVQAGPGLDFVSDSDDLEALYSPEYLLECSSGDARMERLAELRRRIQQHAYRIDADRLATELLRRELLD